METETKKKWSDGFDSHTTLVISVERVPMSMKRREYLRLTGGLVGASATAGCVSTLGGGATSAEGTYLSPPEETGLNVDHPTYGDPVPEAEMLDVFTDEQVSSNQDTEFLMTFFFTFCPTECVWLISSMTHAEARILEKGLDRPRVLAATFDPARDTPERMRDYAERMGIDADAGNWSFLRPEDEETAEEVITGDFGVNFRKATEETESGVYDFLHTTLILLVNEDGYVERTYRNDDPDPDEIASDWETLVEAQKTEEA